MNSLTDNDTRTGTIGGTVLVLLLQINPTQLLTTAVTAATGAAVSFCVAVLFKWISMKYNSRANKHPEKEPGDDTQ